LAGLTVFPREIGCSCLTGAAFAAIVKRRKWCCRCLKNATIAGMGDMGEAAV
jgi:hypothetical protein